MTNISWIGFSIDKHIKTSRETDSIKRNIKRVSSSLERRSQSFRIYHISPLSSHWISHLFFFNLITHLLWVECILPKAVMQANHLVGAHTFTVSTRSIYRGYKNIYVAGENCLHCNKELWWYHIRCLSSRQLELNFSKINQKWLFF